MQAPVPPSATRPSDEALPTTDVQGRPLWRAGTLTYTTAGLVALFAWLLWGDFAWMLKERSVVPVAQLVLKKFAASDTLVAILVGSLPAALGMILGPLMDRSYRQAMLSAQENPLTFASEFFTSALSATILAALVFTLVTQTGWWKQRRRRSTPSF